MKPVIILLNGPRRSGKDTACAAMIDKRPGWHRVSLAEIVKTSAAQALAIDDETRDFYESLKDEPVVQGETWRNIVIKHGNERREIFGDDYWTKQWALQARELFDLGMTAVVMTDCRLPQEIDIAKEITPYVLLMRVYRTAKAQHEPNAWDGDLGSWLFPNIMDVDQVALFNDGHIDDLRYLAYTHTFRYFRNVNGSAPL